MKTLDSGISDFVFLPPKIGIVVSFHQVNHAEYIIIIVIIIIIVTVIINALLLFDRCGCGCGEAYCLALNGHKNGDPV